MSRPTLALVGAGYWGKNLARNFHALGRLHTICDNSQEILGTYQDGYDGVCLTRSFEGVLSDNSVEQVAIAAPAEHHFRLAKAALEAGKDVYVEKPLCLDPRDAEELIQLAESKSSILMVGHLLQYHAYVEKLAELVHAGELGKLFHITSNRLNLGKVRQEENSLWSFAPHDISVILKLASSAPQTVTCHGESYLTDGIADTTLTQLEFDGKLRATISVSWLNPFKEQKLTVVGSKGMAVFDDTKPWDEKLVVYREYLSWTEGNLPNVTKSDGEKLVVPQTEPLKSECQHFLACCESRQTPRTDGHEGLRVLQVLSAAQESLETHVSVSCISKPEANSPVHPTATIDPKAAIGRGTKVWHYSHISDHAIVGENCKLGQNVFVAPHVHIGNNVKIQNNVSVYTGVTIEDDVFLGPSCVLTNVSNPRSQVIRKGIYEETVIRKGATIGANATLVCGITIGRYAFVAAGAVVTQDIPDYGMVIGVPARRTGWMSRHGHILRMQDGLGVCPESGMSYQQIGATIRCLDLDEDVILPPDLATGKQSYRILKTG